MITPEALLKEIAKTTGEVTDHAAYKITKKTAKSDGFIACDKEGDFVVVPFMRFAVGLGNIDGPQLSIVCGDYKITVTRPPQKPTDEDEEDKEGIRILATLMTSLRDRRLLQLQHVENELEIQFAAIEKD